MEAVFSYRDEMMLFLLFSLNVNMCLLCLRFGLCFCHDGQWLETQVALKDLGGSVIGPGGRNTGEAVKDSMCHMLLLQIVQT